MIECNILCFDKKAKDLTGESLDKWLPFSFEMKDVRAYKMTSDIEENTFEYKKTTIFLGKRFEQFLIDIDFEVFRQMHREYEKEKERLTTYNLLRAPRN